VFDVVASRALPDGARARLLERLGPRVTAVAQDERSQARNRELALERLARRLASALAVPRQRTATKPSQAARTRRLEAKRRQADRKRARRPPEKDA
jgi:ribosome-associated protein